MPLYGDGFDEMYIWVGILKQGFTLKQSFKAKKKNDSLLEAAMYGSSSMGIRTNCKSTFPMTNDSVAKTEIENRLDDCFELYSELKTGLQDISLGNTRPFAEAMTDVKVKRAK